MNIETRKINLAQLLFTIQKEDILDKIEALLKRETLSSLTKEQKLAIDEGLKSLEDNGGIPHQDVMNETKKRYPNLFK
ncbi:MAG: hypothetical protein JKY09_01495 [Crocinitomicaceae bacterium]|nr:hypothetical protein [Crocinitomicaceae bacterium]MBL4861678.1 hypothetical protein [Crocinitomicaceae bacterium]